MVSATENLVTASDIADMIGVKVASVWTYKNRGQLPEPIAVIGVSPVWDRATIEAWVANRSTRKGRPPKLS